MSRETVADLERMGRACGLYSLEDYERLTGRPWEPIYYERTTAQIRKPLARSLKAQVWGKTAGFCWYCQKPLNPWRNYHAHHLLPVARGGGDDAANLVPCCSTCNLRKGAR